MALSYEEASAYLKRARRFGIHPSLDGIRALMKALDRPQDALKAVQVGGTNGKSSTARMTAALISAHGHVTGLFTSPHMHEYREQVEVGGKPISPEAFAAAVTQVADAVPAAEATLPEPLTEFELATATALVAFREAGCEWAVLEVGMGGRWDATSIAIPRVAVITGVGLDHTEHLGPTREDIAEEKAQIIREGAIAVLGPGVGGVLEVFLRRAGDQESRALCVRSDTDACEITFGVSRLPDRPGGNTVVAIETERADYSEFAVAGPSYQAANLACAVAAAEAALGRRLDAEAARGALLAVRFPGRFELLSREPLVVADGAHNPEAATVLAGAIEESFGEERPVVVLGVLSDKDAEGIVSALAGVAAGFVATRSDSERALPELEVAKIVERTTGSLPPTRPSVAEAIDLAVSVGSSVIVTGSITVVAEARDRFSR